MDQIISILWFVAERPIPTLPHSDMLSLWPDLRAIFIACIVLNIYKSRFFLNQMCATKVIGKLRIRRVCFIRNDSLLIEQIHVFLAAVSGLFWFIHITQLERNSVYVILIFQWAYISLSKGTVWYVDIISTMITVINDFHYKSWLLSCTTPPHSCVSTLPLYNRKAKDLRLLLPVRGLAVCNS